MARTYAQVTRQIETLKLQAEAQKKRESSGVAASIKEAIAFYGLTAQDLGLTSGERPAAVAEPAPVKAATRKGPAGKRAAAGRKKAPKRSPTYRFQDDQGNRWSGMGRKPGWLVAGLDGGKALEDFAIKDDEPPAAEPRPD